MTAAYIASLCELHNLKFISCRAVNGGDINEAYAVDTKEGGLFLKLNLALKYPSMFENEAEGLEALHQVSKLKVPEVIASGTHEDQQYLFMSWLEKATLKPDTWILLSEGLTQLHQVTHKQFGWSSSNYIGSLIQPNDPADTWEEFYATQRIMPLIEVLFNAGSMEKTDVTAAEKVCSHFKDVFPNEPPALLHGDLWAGNFMAVQSVHGNCNNVQPSIFDPAVYYGHREMDIGMMQLFGGVDKQVYEVYNELYPLEKNWRDRLPLTQLYPLLVHAILFGGSYIEKCRSILKQKI